MEFGGLEKKGKKRKEVGGRGRYKYAGKLCKEEEDDKLFSNHLTFYDQIPDVNLSVDEFEKYALARLKVLRIIERVNLTSTEKFSPDWYKAVEAELRKAEDLAEFRTALCPVGSEDEDIVLLSRKFDQISHFLLRLAFAGTEEMRRWFISLELDVLKFRLRCVSPYDLKTFLKEAKFPGELLDDQRKQKVRPEIVSASGISLGSFDKVDMYKLDFTMALDLVRHRRVFLKNGFAYVSYTDLMSVLCGAFRSYLSEAMSMMKKNMHIVAQDERIMRAIADFDRRHTGNDYSAKTSTTGISVGELENLSQKSFPLCMKTLYDVVVKEHHLKHFGRLQFGLFLKAIGLPMEDAVKFWRGHFTKKPDIDGSRFDKQYLYNIRHMYGQEGKRASYTPYSCMKVINSNVGPGDYHGCPFKHSDASHLRTKLQQAQIPANGVREIMELVEKHHYQIACQKYFEFTHNGLTVEGGVNHPNQYFEESRDVLTGRKTLKAQEKLPTKRVVIRPSQMGSQSQTSQSEQSGEFEQMETEEDLELLSAVSNSNWPDIT